MIHEKDMQSASALAELNTELKPNISAIANPRAQQKKGKGKIGISTADQYASSRKPCDAALHILQHQLTLHDAMQPDGQLHQDRWKVSSGLSHDFLLAVTILCLEVDFYLGNSISSSIRGVDMEKMETTIKALRGSYRIWLETSSSSRSPESG